MLTVAVTFGVVVSIVLTELTGISPGGIIVPGYVALILDRPAALGGLLVLTTGTYWTIRLLSTALLLYGSRRFGVTVLVGLAFSATAQVMRVQLDPPLVEWTGLGYIVPGLLAHQWDRQGVWPTLLMLAVAAPVVHLLGRLVLQW